MSLRIAVALLVSMGLAPASATDFGASRVYIEAYLDEAPKGAVVVEEVQLTRDGHDRVLMIVTARSGSAEHPGTAFGDEEVETAIRVIGAKDQVERLMQLESGSRIEGNFKFGRSSRTLLVGDVES